MFANPDDDYNLRIIDFGLAEKLGEGEERVAMRMCGTLEYMSPEVIAEQGHDMQSDWWALGIVLYELATGSPPFISSDPDIMAESIRFDDIRHKDYFSDEFKDLMDKLTHKLP